MEPQSDTERDLADCVRRGEPFFGIPPGVEAGVDQLPEVRGAFLRGLLLEALVRRLAGAPIAIHRVRISGHMPASGIGRAEAPLPPLELFGCIADGRLDLSECCVTRLRIVGCRIRELLLTNLLSSFDVNLSLTTIDSELMMMNARVGGNLVLNGTYVDARPGDPDSEDRTVRAATGPFRAVSADGIDVRGDVFMRPAGNPGNQRSFIAKGAVAFPGATVRGDFSFGGAVLEAARGAPDADNRSPVFGAALVLDRAQIAGDLAGQAQNGRRLDTIGRISLVGAQIGGDAVFAGADLGNDDGVAMNADGASIGQSLSFDCIPGQGKPDEPDGLLQCRISGVVRLIEARIGSQLSLSGARMAAADEAIAGGGARIEGGLFVVPYWRGAEAEPVATEIDGTLGFPNATIGYCRLERCRLSPGLARTDAFAPCAIFEGATIRTALLVALAPESRGVLSLESAHVGNLPNLDVGRWGAPPRLEADGKWSGVRLELDELSYDRGDVAAGEGTGSRQDRAADSRLILAWLARQYVNGEPTPQSFRPQPYEQAARLLRGKGDRYGAGRVGSAKRQLQRRCVDRGLAGFGNWLFHLFFDYGYSPARTVVWGLLFLALGLGGVELLKRTGGLVSSEPAISFAIRPQAQGSAPLIGETVRSEQPCAADTLGFTLDSFLPLVDLGFDRRCVVAPPRMFPAVRAAEYGLLLYSLIGLVFVPIAALTFAGVLRSD